MRIKFAILEYILIQIVYMVLGKKHVVLTFSHRFVSNFYPLEVVSHGSET